MKALMALAIVIAIAGVAQAQGQKTTILSLLQQGFELGSATVTERQVALFLKKGAVLYLCVTEEADVNVWTLRALSTKGCVLIE